LIDYSGKITFIPRAAVPPALVAMDGDVFNAKATGFCWSLRSKLLSSKSARMPISSRLLGKRETNQVALLFCFPGLDLFSFNDFV